MKKQLFILLLTICSLNAVAQSLSQASVKTVKLRDSGSIIQNGQVKGYFNFYNLEKKDRKNNNYLLSVTDENLREINSVNIVRPNSYLLVDGVFNENSFGFLFYDVQEGSIEMIAYDKALKQTGKVIKKLENKYANATYAYLAKGNEPMQALFVAVPNKGFLYYGILNDSKCDYEIEFYDNSMKKGWTSRAPKDEFDFENAAEAFQSEEYVGSLIAKRTALLDLNPDFDLLVQNIKDGKALFRIPMTTQKYKTALAEIIFDKDKQQFVLFGEYYNKTDNVIKDQSQGFITLVLDIKGKILSEKTNSWKADITKVVDAKDKEKFENTSILFHDFVRTSDGQLFAIGEQYKKGGTPMAVKLNVFDMMIFQFDENFAIKKVHVFAKDKNTVPMQPGLLITSSKLLSYIAKSYGGFDFAFTQVPEDRKTFVVTYVNYDREKGEKGKNLLGSIIYTPEKVFTVDKIELSRKSTIYSVYRAKEGYVMVSEYFEKEKRREARLEKLNY